MSEKASSTDRTEIDDCTPADAKDLYIREQTPDHSEATVANHNTILDNFVKWCGREEIESIHELDRRALREYLAYLRAGGFGKADNLSHRSTHVRRRVLQTFLSFCEDIGAIEPGISDRVPSL